MRLKDYPDLLDPRRSLLGMEQERWLADGWSALLRHADDAQPLIACGEWHGEILDAPRGTAGFGYDPLFLVSELEQTAAEIPSELKNVLSHRGNAFRQLLDKLRAEPV